MRPLWLCGVAGLLAWSLTAQVRPTVDFSHDVEPVLKARCQGCHNAQVRSSGLRLDGPEAVTKGGDSGPVIVPGQSTGSKLIERVSSDKKGFTMPPAGARLTPAEIATLRSWIDAGANWPAASTATVAIAAAPRTGGHWSYRPIQRPAAPDVRQRTWVRNPIDAFVLARLETENVAPSPEAAKTTLLRRISLDLTGLPPTPAEQTAFLSDNRPDAYERLIDRLLSSPHYGEKWGRHWLDLAHYADSDGYEKDQVRNRAWRYRQWVIEATNQDKPFDQFTIEQLAGDLLPNATVEQRVATGFLRQTLTNREAGVDRGENRFEQLVNRTNTVGTVWLGLTVGCAQCHNHKFDALSQKEYYQFMAYFDRANEANIPAPLPGEAGPYLQARPTYDRQRNALLTQYNVAESQAGWETKMRRAVQHPGEDLEWDFPVTSYRVMVDDAEKLLMKDEAQRTQAEREIVTDYFLSNPGPDISIRDKDRAKSLKECRDKLVVLAANFTFLTQAMTMEEEPKPAPSHLRVGGDWRTPGAVVEPGTPAVLPPLPANAPMNRLTLARWIVSRDNPLTARVAVNRVWQELFGRGLVRTTDDFGTQGEKPSHPELLDWLAAEFRDNGYSQKALLKTVLLSATYRQSSQARPELAQRDPENVLLARQSRLRLTAELIRDESLAVSGLLDTRIGGKSVRPPQPAGVAELGYGNSVKWNESTGPDRYRRGLYIHFQRTTPYPMLMTFDAPDSNVACPRRRRSNTPLQALNLLNDPVFFEAAQGLASRLAQETPGTPAEQINAAVQLCLSRPANARERDRLLSFYDQQLQAFRQDAKARDAFAPLPPEQSEAARVAALAAIGRVLLNLDEFLNRE